MPTFSQNICGSGFFHHLNEADTEPSDSDTTDIPNGGQDHDNEKAGMVLPFDKSYFSLFYNNSPSQVDPHYQPVSTLTKRGDEFRKKSGTGIGWIEIELIDKDGSRVEAIRTGSVQEKNVCNADRINYSVELLRMKRICEGASTGPRRASCHHRVCIRIQNTLLDAKILQSWIELSLNQALVGFQIESVLMQRATTCSDASASPIHPSVAEDWTGSNLNQGMRSRSGETSLICSREVDSLCKGIPALLSIISRSFDLPHPAVVKRELSSKVAAKATLLAPLTLSLLDDALLHDLHPERRGSKLSYRGGAVIIRTAPAENAMLVTIDRDASTGSVRVAETISKGRPRKVVDRATDSPEYIVAFGLGYSRENDDGDDNDDAADKRRHSSAFRSKLVFRELVVEDPSEDSFSKRLRDFKSLRPDLFKRSLAFILHVTRSSRVLYVYNWNQASLSSVISRMESIENEIIQSNQQVSLDQQARCLRGLNLWQEDVTGTQKIASLSTKKAGKLQLDTSKVGGQRPPAPDQGNPLTKTQPKEGPTPPPPRKIRRPTNILRPTLIGKSVEGSAMQALAASRARASSKTMPGQLRPQPVAATGRQSTKSRKERQSTTAAPSVAAAAAAAAAASAAAAGPSNKATKPKKEATGLLTRIKTVGEKEGKASGPSHSYGQNSLGHQRSNKSQRNGSMPPKLAEFFLALKTTYSSVMLKRRIPISMAQHLVAKLMMYAQLQKCNVEELRYIIGHSIPLFSTSCEITQCGIDQAMPFLSFFAKRVVGSNRNASILSIESTTKPFVYVRQDLAGSRSCRAILFAELTATRHSATQQLIGRARGWLFIHASTATIGVTKKKKKKSRRSVNRFATSSRSKKEKKTKALTNLEKTSSSLHSAISYYRVSFCRWISRHSSSLLRTLCTTSPITLLSLSLFSRRSCT